MFPPTARFLAEVFAKRDLGLALFTYVRFYILCIYKYLIHLLSNLLTPVGAQLCSARAHDVIGRRDVGLLSSGVDWLAAELERPWRGWK
jgi:hypothetical protein